MKTQQILNAASYQELFNRFIVMIATKMGLDQDQLLDKIKTSIMSNAKDPVQSDFMYRNLSYRLRVGQPELNDLNVVLKALDMKLTYVFEPTETIPLAKSGHPAIWDQTIDTLGLNVRPANCLATESVCGTPQGSLEYIGQLVGKTEEDLRKIPNLGDKGIENIIERLAAYGLTLGTDTQGWEPPTTQKNQPIHLWNRLIASIPELTGYPGGCLANEGIHYVGQLIAMHPNALSKIPGIGHSTELKIKTWVAGQGLTFETNTKGWFPLK